MTSADATFAEFYARSRDKCLHAVLASIGDRQAAEDCLAEAFARAFAAWRKVSRHPAPAAWVVRTALNLAVSSWRKTRREVPSGGYLAGPGGAGQAAGAIGHAPGPVDPEIMAALAAMPARQRQVIALRIFLDLDTKQTAEVLGIAPGTVTAHLARAVATLRSQLAPYATAKWQAGETTR